MAKPDGTGLGGLTVVAFEWGDELRGMRERHVLGQSKTDSGGCYAIQYGLDQLANPAKGSADLMVQAFGEDAKEPLASSPLILNALEEEVVNLSVGGMPIAARASLRSSRSGWSPGSPR